MHGCDEDATHDLGALITVDRIGLEDSTVDAGVCCDHLDRLSDNTNGPYVYLTVCGRVADAPDG